MDSIVGMASNSVFVYWCWGELKSCSDSPYSTIFPLCMTAMLSAM